MQFQVMVQESFAVHYIDIVVAPRGLLALLANLTPQVCAQLSPPSFKIALPITSLHEEALAAQEAADRTRNQRQALGLSLQLHARNMQ